MNLRKDHCRDPDEDDRERVNETPPGRDSPRPGIVPPRRASPGARGRSTNPGAEGAKEHLPRERRPPAARGRPSAPTIIGTERLSATDISALASMKNVAKCDTWCELQNPANHRVFERKLRPRPSGRGHACLGVTPSTLRAPSPEAGAGRGEWPPAPSGTDGRRAGRRRSSDTTGAGTRRASPTSCPRPSRRGPRGPPTAADERIDASDRDPRSGGATRRV